MKDIIRYLLVIVYLFGLWFSIIYSIANPLKIYYFLETGTGSPLTVCSAVILFSSCILFLISVVYTIIVEKKERDGESN